MVDAGTAHGQIGLSHLPESGTEIRDVREGCRLREPIIGERVRGADPEAVGERRPAVGCDEPGWRADIEQEAVAHLRVVEWGELARRGVVGAARLVYVE